jgi:flagellar hook-associated protein 2
VSTSIDGLISGMNTTQMISQLMAVERLPGNQLQRHKAADQSMVTVLQGLNSLFSKLQTAAAPFVPDTITGASVWTGHSVSSTAPAIATATAGDKAASGRVAFLVTSLATAGQAITAAGVAARTDAVTDGPIVLTKGTVTTRLNLAAGSTLNDVVIAINAAGAGVAANVVQDSTGSYRLQLTSTTTGKDTAVSLDAGTLNAAASPLGATKDLAAAADTVLHIGGTAAGAYDVSSATSTVTGLLPDVTINVTKADPGTQVTLEVTSDSAAMADKMAALVGAANGALSEIVTRSRYDADSKTAGPLLGNSFVQGLRRGITDAVIGSSTSTPAMHGVSVTREGTLAFDRDVFLAAYAKDPATASASLTTMATKLQRAAKDAADPVVGQITAQIKSYQDGIKDVTKRITAFEDRMGLKQQALQLQFSHLELALGKLKSQSEWLAGQLAGLPTYSTTSK